MKELKEIYRKRKSQLLPLIFGFAAFFVLIRVILPQISDIQAQQTEIAQKTASLETSKANLDILQSVPNETVDGDYLLATTALPIQKDVVLIYTELNDAATKTNVKLGGFSVKVGGIYSQGKQAQISEQSVDGIPYLNILITATGTSSDLKGFAEQLYKSIPLVDINSVDISATNARYDVNFYFKPIALRPTGTQVMPIQKLGIAEEAQISVLKSWSSSNTSQ